MPSRIDSAILQVVRTRGHSPAVDRAVVSFTELGDHGRLWLGLAAAGAVLDSRCRSRYARAGAAVGATYGINQLFKHVVGRSRPVLPELPPLVVTGSQISYPSAHASTSFAGAHALVRALPAVAPLLYALAVAMALSRLYCGVHYPSDIVAGALLGTAVAELAR